MFDETTELSSVRSSPHSSIPPFMSPYSFLYIFKYIFYIYPYLDAGVGDAEGKWKNRTWGIFCRRWVLSTCGLGGGGGGGRVVEEDRG